ncbi:MAG: hypothetical protein FWD98_03510 [Defluviitaleaceae bacterium]|nr:hypothetical protein [Defluviitaleaceae bacterium]
MSERKIIFEIAAVYTAVIIGAGFATGRELISFFLDYGRFAVPGLLLSGVLMALAGWATLEVCARRGLAGFDDLVAYAAGSFAGGLIKAGAVAFLFVIFAAMLSAAGALGSQLLGLPRFAGALAMCLLCLLAFSFDIRGLVRVSALLAPVLILGSIGLGLYTYLFDAVATLGLAGETLRQNWVSSAVIYAAYNMITVIAMLAAVSASVRTRRAAVLGVAAGAGAVTLIALSLMLGLSRGLPAVSGFAVPFLRLVQDYGAALQWAYVAVLAAAIYTTAITNGYCFYLAVLNRPWRRVCSPITSPDFPQDFCQNARKRQRRVPKGTLGGADAAVWQKDKGNREVIGEQTLGPWIAKVAMCAAALAFSQIEFTHIVERVYPVFGVLGLFLAAIIVITAAARVKPLPK